MIAGGDVNGDDTMTEIDKLVSNKSTPSFGQLPSSRCPSDTLCSNGAVGVMLGNAPLLCGGVMVFGSSYFDTCISYHQDSKWIQSKSMVQGRGYATGVKVNSTTFWILGGRNGSSRTCCTLDSTEFIIEGQTNGIPGPKLPSILYSPCAIKFTQNQIFVIGGYDNTFYRKEVWIYDPQNGFARTQGPSLIMGRFGHSCSTMKDGEKTVIIIAGGHGRGFTGTINSVEIYDPTDNTWHSGKNKFPRTKILKCQINLIFSI